MNYSTLDFPVFLLDSPDNFSTETANNKWMKEIPPEKRKVDKEKAWRQWLNLYNYMASEAYVVTLPELKNTEKLQDLTFVANLGIVLHTGQCIISNFTSPPRKGETVVGAKFLSQIIDDVIVCPFKFEGDAELKWLHDNVYLGGYGIRSEIKSYFWMMNNYDVKIIPLKETNEYCYHLDCTIFPLNQKQTMVCTKAFEPEEIKLIEKVTEIIDVSQEDCKQGITNNIRLHNIILNAHSIENVDKKSDSYAAKFHKNQSLEKIATKAGMEVCYFNLSEYEKGGALLSCCVMHLNRWSYSVDLLGKNK